MDKVNSVVQRGNNIQVAHKTILGKYKALAESAGGELSPDRLYKFLSRENARVLNKCKPDGTPDEQTLEECKVFAAFYTTRINQKTRRSVSDRFGGLPFLLRTGINEIAKNPQTFPWKCPLNLTDDQLVQMHSFVKYVEGLDANRLASIHIKDPDGNQEVKEAVPLDRDMTTESMKTRRSLFLAYMGYMVQFEGRLTLRLCLPDRKYILMGFCANNGKLRPISAEQMEQVYSNGPVEARTNVEFRTPAWP